jgi:hypothetical protein
MSDKEERENLFARLARDNLKGMDSEVMALGYLMSDWLRAQIADAGTGVDAGAGMDSFDLWVTVGGKELLVNIRKSRGQLLKEQGNV